MGSCCSQEGRNENVDGGKGKPNDVTLEKDTKIEERVGSSGEAGPEAERGAKRGEAAALGGNWSGAGETTGKREAEPDGGDDHKADINDGKQRDNGVEGSPESQPALDEDEIRFAKGALAVESTKEEINVSPTTYIRKFVTSADRLPMSRTPLMESSASSRN